MGALANRIFAQLKRQAEKRHETLSPPAELLALLSLVVAYNDGLSPGDEEKRITADSVIRIIKDVGGGEFINWGPSHLDRCCRSFLTPTRFSFRHATDPDPGA